MMVDIKPLLGLEVPTGPRVVAGGGSWHEALTAQGQDGCWRWLMAAQELGTPVA